MVYDGFTVNDGDTQVISFHLYNSSTTTGTQSRPITVGARLSLAVHDGHRSALMI